MKNRIISRLRATAAFTLIELLVVIAIIGILASLVFPVGQAVKKSATLKKARTELAQLVLAIESYKLKYGHYPPDVPLKSSGWPTTNQLYFELAGTKFANGEYTTLDGSARVADNDGAFKAAFGTRADSKPAVRGFINCTRAASADDAPAAQSFLTQLRPTQYCETSPGSGVRVLVCSVPWPDDNAYQPLPGNKGLNPWRYVSSGATNNPGSYDLWVDVIARGKIHRVNNWSKEPQIVSQPL